MNDSPSILDLPDDEWCRRLDALLAQLPPAAPNAHAPVGQAAVDFLRRPLPQPVLDDLAAAVASPVQVVADEHWRAVVVMRFHAVVVELRSGLVRAALLRDDGRLTTIARPEPGIRLLHSPQGRDWPHHWLRAWCWRQGATADPADLLEEVSDAARLLWRRARRDLDLRAMRRKVAAAMDYQPTAWRRAVRVAHAVDRDPDHRHYNVAIRFAGQLDLLEREAPNLMAPWVALACDGAIDPHREPKAALKQWVRKIAGSSRAWKSLAASPARVWTVWSKRGSPRPIGPLGMTVLLVDSCATAEPIPLPVMRALIERFAPLVSVIHERIAFYPLAARAGAEASTSEAWSTFIDELDAVDAWFDAEELVLDKLQWRRGWPWLVRKARAWAEMRRRQEQSREALIPALPPLEAGGYVFTAAHTPFDLWNAGRLLRNCLGCSSYRTIQGHSNSLVVLATRSVDGRLRAAIKLFQPADGSPLQAMHALGFANGQCPSEVRRLLPRVAEHFDRLGRGRLLPWKFGWRRQAAPPLARCPMPLKVVFGTGELRLTVSGSVQIGHLLRDYTTRPIGERFEVAWLIRGGQAQRLAEHAIARAGGPVETLDALAEAMAAALAAPPGLAHWITAFDAFSPDTQDGGDDENCAADTEVEQDEPPLDASSREAVLDLLDHLARDSSQRERRGRRQRSAA